MSITDELRDWVLNHYSGWPSKQAEGFAIADRIDAEHEKGIKMAQLRQTSDAQKLDIYERYCSGEKPSDIALTFGISLSTVYRAIRKQRKEKGETSKLRQMSDAQKRDIYERYCSGARADDIASAFGIGLSTVYRIISKQREELGQLEIETIHAPSFYTSLNEMAMVPYLKGDANDTDGFE